MDDDAEEISSLDKSEECNLKSLKGPAINVSQSGVELRWWVVPNYWDYNNDGYHQTTGVIKNGV